jgi:iron complex transport system substrate-binding protein
VILREENIKEIQCLLALFALAIPLAAAAEPANTDLLSVFGNANMDDEINEADIAYVEDIISGKNEPTKLADANYDGQIDAQDIDRIN